MPETRVPTTPPKLSIVELGALTWPMIARSAKVRQTPRIKTMVQWPSENQNPTDRGRLPYAISFRVVLSIAEM